LIQPILEEITRATQETSAFNQLKGDVAEVVATVPSTQRLVWHMHRGDLAPLYATSGGKAILANLPEAMRAEYLRTVTFKAVTPKTIRSKRELQRQIVAIRDEGIAYSFEEFHAGDHRRRRADPFRVGFSARVAEHRDARGSAFEAGAGARGADPAGRRRARAAAIPRSTAGQRCAASRSALTTRNAAWRPARRPDVNAQPRCGRGLRAASRPCR
jgi:hypothetical protein